jgi:NADPH:quinone reductase
VNKKEEGMSKAVIVHQFGGPEVLSVEDRPTPAPEPGQVLIEQKVIGLNFVDTYYRSGHYSAPLPFVPGSEGAGEVLVVGKGVKGLKEGDRVAYAGQLGAYAQRRVVAASALVKLPKSISYEQAAAMMLKGLTAQFLLRRTYKVRAGDVLLVHAGAGGVGQILCQWANYLGATVIATVGSEEKANIAKEAGAKHVILYREEDFVERVRQITKGKLCHVVYDGVGRSTFPASLDCLRPFGLFASYGSASGPIENFDLGLLSRKGSLFATRPTLITHVSHRPTLEKMADELMRVVRKGRVRIPIYAKFTLDQAQDAHRALEERRTVGSTILIP